MVRRKRNSYLFGLWQRTFPTQKQWHSQGIQYPVQQICPVRSLSCVVILHLWRVRNSY